MYRQSMYRQSMHRQAMRRIVRACARIFLGFHLIAATLAAQAAPARTDTPSGLPVPRFVSLKNAETFCRSGPSFDHPVAVTYLKAGAPVLVVAETVDHWRKVRDADGAECWAHQATLRAPTHALVIEEVALHARPDAASPVRARLGRSVLARVDKSDGAWTLVAAGGLRGWAETMRLWGVDADIAPHN